jgi:hypothetical protein
METDTKEDKNLAVVDTEIGVDGQPITIDPAKEAAARRKFDKFLLPVSLIFIVLSALDRNNVSAVFPPKSFHLLSCNRLDLL